MRVIAYGILADEYLCMGSASVHPPSLKLKYINGSDRIIPLRSKDFDHD
jgi:hypothetical protein